MPIEIIYGFAYLKKAAAYTNAMQGFWIKTKETLSQVFVTKSSRRIGRSISLVIWQTDPVPRAI